MDNFMNPGKMKAIFLTRVLALDPGRKLYGVQSFKSKDQREAENPENWENVFMGTEEECHNFAKNLHHAIDPNMIDKFDPRTNVKRVLN